MVEINKKNGKSRETFWPTRHDFDVALTYLSNGASGLALNEQINGPIGKSRSY